MRDIRSVARRPAAAPARRATRSSCARRSRPGTTEFVAGYLDKQRGFAVGEDVFVAHVPERIAAGRFFEEIETLPCIVGGVGERSGEVAGASCSSVFGAPIVQTTPVQAELAKIWTNILRYATFALPNLLMMDCEQYGANVFEVIDLINRDYPRGGMAQPGFTAGTCLRKDFTFSEERSQRAGHAARRLARQRVACRCSSSRASSGASARCAGRKVAVLGLAFKADTDDERDSLAHKLVRLLERELADVAVHDPHVATPTQSFEEAVLDADAVVVATNHSEFRDAGALRAIADSAAARRARRRPVELLGRRRRSSRYAEPRSPPLAGPAATASVRPCRVSSSPAAPARSARPSCAACCATPTGRCASSDQREAPQWMREGCEVHTGDLRDLDEAREAIAGLLARHPPRGDRRRHRATSTSCPTR